MSPNSFAGGEGLVLGQLLNRVNMGGAENYVVLVSNFHASLGRPSRVIVLTRPGPLSDRFNAGVKVRYLGFERASIRNPMAFLRSLVRGFRVLAGAVRDEKLDLLQTHLPDANMWGLAMALARRCPVVITVHSNRFLEFPEGTRLGSFIKYHAYRLMLKRCGAVVTVSEQVRESLLQRLNVTEEMARKVVAVNNGVTVPPVLPDADRTNVRDQFGIAEDTAWLVTAGRFNQVKNFQCLIRAAGLLRDRGVRFRVLIAGDGELRPELEALCRDLELDDHILMPGNLDNLPDIMRSADLLVMPSLWEGLPLVLLEGMACGLAAVGSRTRGIADILVERETGLLAEVNDVSGFADSIEELLADRSRRLRMGEVARQLVLDNYSLQKTYSDLCRVYSMVLGK
jgi:glycosyltransferase involved in cell wall biosynthesis